MATALAKQLRSTLSAAADPSRAPSMQAYMKSAMPFLGVPSPDMRAIAKSLFASLRHADAAEWRADVIGIWRGAAYREEYYAAIELAGMRFARPFQTMAALPMYREMIMTGGWWDTTDAIAPNRLWEILVTEPTPMRAVLLSWATDDNLWVRRAAILCQMKAKQQMDLDLLYACIEPSIASKEFFLRKAIGWVLRHHARTDPDEIRRYVTANADRLSNLSKREALKHLG